MTKLHRARHPLRSGDRAVPPVPAAGCGPVRTGARDQSRPPGAGRSRTPAGRRT